MRTLNSGKRYSLMLGKFGTYFYDNYEGKDLTNNDILTKLEKLNDYQETIIG